MPQIVTKSILSISFIVALFLLLVWSSNSTELIITSSPKTKQALKPELYYAQAGEPLSETKKIVGAIVSSGNFLFKLPYPFTSIDVIRYDPTKKFTATVEITAITLIEKEWFKENTYTIPLKHFTPLHQLDKYTTTKDKITFQTTGSDPQLSLDPKPILVSSSYLNHLHHLIISLMIYIIVISLYRLSQKSDQDESTHAKLILYALFFAFSTFKVLYYKENVHFSHPVNELTHLSHTQSNIIPTPEENSILNTQKEENCLEHSPLYYHVMNFVYTNHYSPCYNVQNFRELSATLLVVSYLILLIIMFQTKLSLLSHVVYLTLVTSIPMYAYLETATTGDALGMLAVALFMYTLQKILQHHYHTSTYLLLGLSILIGFLSQFTITVLMGFTGILFLLYVWSTKYPLQTTKMKFSLLILLLLPILSYALMSLDWLEKMLHTMQGEWLSLFILLLFAFFALFSQCNEKVKTYCVLGKVTFIALLTLFSIYSLFSYQINLYSDFIGELQIKYTLPFLASFAIMASIFVDKMNKSFWLSVLILFICIQTLYSDFFYFLQL
jgi:hypothetical protein